MCQLVTASWWRRGLGAFTGVCIWGRVTTSMDGKVHYPGLENNRCSNTVNWERRNERDGDLSVPGTY